MFRVPIGLTVALFGLHSAATEDAAAGCYASYSSGGSYKKDSYASATFTEVTAMTTASCTVGTPGCGSNGFKTASCVPAMYGAILLATSRETVNTGVKFGRSYLNAR